MARFRCSRPSPARRSARSSTRAGNPPCRRRSCAPRASGARSPRRPARGSSRARRRSRSPPARSGRARRRFFCRSQIARYTRARSTSSFSSGYFWIELGEVPLRLVDLLRLKGGHAAVELLAGVLGEPGELLEGLRLLRRRRLGAAGQAQLLHLLLELVDAHRERRRPGPERSSSPALSLKNRSSASVQRFDIVQILPGGLSKNGVFYGAAAVLSNAREPRRGMDRGAPAFFGTRRRSRCGSRSGTLGDSRRPRGRIAAREAAAGPLADGQRDDFQARRRTPDARRQGRRSEEMTFVWNAETRINGVLTPGREGHRALRNPARRPESRLPDLGRKVALSRGRSRGPVWAAGSRRGC